MSQPCRKACRAAVPQGGAVRPKYHHRSDDDQWLTRICMQVERTQRMLTCAQQLTERDPRPGRPHHQPNPRPINKYSYANNIETTCFYASWSKANRISPRPHTTPSAVARATCIVSVVSCASSSLDWHVSPSCRRAVLPPSISTLSPTADQPASSGVAVSTPSMQPLLLSSPSRSSSDSGKTPATPDAASGSGATLDDPSSIPAPRN